MIGRCFYWRLNEAVLLLNGDPTADVGVGKTRGLLDRANRRTRMGHRSSIHRSITLALPNSIVPMSTEQTRIPNLQFRVLVIGRANAGKTSILQRVCEATESPKIYRGGEEVRGREFCPQTSDLTAQPGHT